MCRQIIQPSSISPAISVLKTIRQQMTSDANEELVQQRMPCKRKERLMKNALQIAVRRSASQQPNQQLIKSAIYQTISWLTT